MGHFDSADSARLQRCKRAIRRTYDGLSDHGHERALACCATLLRIHYPQFCLTEAREIAESWVTERSPH